ncbi:MAG TPA: hypothetical protein PLM81_00010 [Ginsengibacter sp.]|nr:hypothetical protein [Ginsengibacter sp.]HRP44820.1 hypothetical protein [Ginsengibacter sp.]
MKFREYKVLFVFLFFCLSALWVSAQENRFIYIQTEDGKPFYVRMGLSIFSSTSEGYVLLSRLADGNHQMYVGFPRNEFPEEEFSLTLNGQSEGYLLKYLNNRWVLMNIESLALTEGAVSTPPVAETREKEYDPFSSLLASVVNDSSILNSEITAQKPQKSVIDSAKRQQVREVQPQETVITENKETEKKALIPEGDSSVSTVSVQDSAVRLSPLSADTVKIVTTAGELPGGKIPDREPPINWGEVSRLLLVKETDGLELVYLDKERRDTIRLFMPVTSYGESQPPQPKVVYREEKKDSVTSLTITPTKIVEPPAESNVVKAKDNKEKELPEKEVEKPVSSELAAPKKPAGNLVGEEQEPKKQEKTPQIIYTPSVNSDCSAYATNSDFLKIRKKMAAETDTDKMIDAAKKFFRQKCYTTDQIKNLSYLFLDDEGRYKFFDAAYPFASDSNLYYQLESQLQDPYYIKRFQAMIQK